MKAQILDALRHIFAGTLCLTALAIGAALGFCAGLGLILTVYFFKEIWR